MDGFEVNKILMAVILALLIGMVSGKISEVLLHPQVLAKNVYVIEGVEDTSDATPSGEVKEKLEPVEPLLATADLKNGEQIAKKCLQCHTLEKGGQSRIGPNLYNIVNARYAHVEGYPYSATLKDKKDLWTYENLNGFLYKPKEFFPGTKMTFIGLRKTQDRADLIAYLRSLSDSPALMPTPVAPAPVTAVTAPDSTPVAMPTATLAPTVPVPVVSESAKTVPAVAPH